MFVPAPFRCFAIAALALALLCLSAAPASARPKFRTSLSNPGGLTSDFFTQTRSAGAEFVRIPLNWRKTAPASEPSSWNPENPDDPAYSWGESDEAVQNAVAAGLTPVLIVDGGPTWVQRCQAPSFALVPLCDPDPEDLKEFAIAASRRYNGQTPGVPPVKYWQGLNEPNLSLFFFPQYETNGKTVSPRLYRALINAFYAGVKSVQRSDVVIAAGLGPIAVPKYTIGPLQFAREMLCMAGTKKPHPKGKGCAGGVHFDIFAIQPYTTGSPTHKGGPNDVELGDLGKLQTLIGAADRAGHIKGMHHRTPLWVTEFSYDTKPPDPHGLPTAIATRWVAESIYVAWKAKVENFFWYSLRDEPPEGRGYANTIQSGLYFRGKTVAADRPKPIRAAFRFPFVAYPGSKLSFWGRTPNGRPGPVEIQTLSSGHWKTVGTARAARDGTFHGGFGTRYGRDERGDARAVFRGAASPAFSMKPVPDFSHPPFG